MRIYEAQERTPELIERLVAVWEASVRATHLFLTNEEILSIKQYVPQALNGVAHLLVAASDGVPVAFMGVDGDRLEMLFLSPDVRGNGLGKQLLQQGIEQYGVREMTVNEQNPQAVGFYEHCGFRTYRRTAHDEQGGPYPLLYMQLKKSISFAEASRQISEDRHGPFLCDLREDCDNRLVITICRSQTNPEAQPEQTGNAAFDSILEQCTPIEPDELQTMEIVFENYIIYQVRNESYCSYDPDEKRIGKYLSVFEKSKLLDALPLLTDAVRFEDGTYFTDVWKHYGIDTQNQIIAVVSHAEPKVYQ